MSKNCPLKPKRNHLVFPYTMKYDDIFFKLVALIVIAGVILAFTSPAQTNPAEPAAIVAPAFAE